MNNFFNRWPILTAILAILASIAAITFLVRQNLNANRRPKGEIWFYDLKTRHLFAESDRSVPPINTKSGINAGVRAFVYTCDGDLNPTNRFVAFLEKLTPEAKQAAEEALNTGGGQMSVGFALEKQPDGILVSLPETEQWFLKLSEEGRKVMQIGTQKGGCAHPKLCLP